MTTALAPGVITRTSSTLPVQTDRPGTEMAALTRMRPRFTKCRALMAGNEAVRAGETDYLAQLEGESDDSYAVRKVLAALFPGYARTVLASVGMLLQEEPVLGEDVAPAIHALWENIDGAGTHGAVFARQLAQDGLVDGFSGILVDYPRTDPTALAARGGQASAAATNGAPLSADDEARLGLRPYWIPYRVDDVIKAVYQTIDGVRTLVLLELREQVEERVGKFGIVTRTQHRVYTREVVNGRVTIFHELWKTPVTGGNTPELAIAPAPMQKFTAIPWAPNKAGQRVSENEYKPPLLDLADLNLEHHQVKTNMLSLEMLACVPALVRIGAKPDADGVYPPITLGPRNTIEAPAVDGVAVPIYWLTVDVSVLAPARQTLQDTEGAMSREGGAFLAPDPNGVESAEAKRIKGTAQRATLSTVGRALQDCLEAAVGFTSEVLGVEGGSVTVNADFTGEPIDPQYLAVLVSMLQENVITAEELRHVLATGQLPETFTEAGLSLLAERMADAEQGQGGREGAAA